MRKITLGLIMATLLSACGGSSSDEIPANCKPVDEPALAASGNIRVYKCE